MESQKNNSATATATTKAAVGNNKKKAKKSTTKKAATKKSASPFKKGFEFKQRDIDLMTIPLDQSMKKYGMTRPAVYSRRTLLSKHFGNLEKAEAAARVAAGKITTNNNDFPGKKKLTPKDKGDTSLNTTTDGSYYNIDLGSAKVRIKQGLNFRLEDGTIVVD
jgi:hypothetical protein